MRYILYIMLVNIMVNISLKMGGEPNFFSQSFFSSDVLVYCAYCGFILSFYLYSKASKKIDVSILFPVTQGGTIVATILAEYIIFSTYISLLSVVGIVLIMVGVFFLTPERRAI
ncbi:MAG: SMR family transporter [Desulfovibrionaceae bacterium]